MHTVFCDDQGYKVHKDGIAAIFGLNFSKIITSVFGGIVTTDDDELAERLKRSTKRLKTASIKKSWRRRLYYIAATLSLWPPLFRGIKLIEKTGFMTSFSNIMTPTKSICQMIT